MGTGFVGGTGCRWGWCRLGAVAVGLVVCGTGFRWGCLL